MLQKGINTIINSTHDAMVAVDLEGKIVIFNSAAEKLIGKLASEAIGQPVVDIIQNTRLTEVLKTGKSEINQQQNLGNTIIITNRVPVLDEKGIIIGAV